MSDADVISNDVKPIKNSFGLPTGELYEGNQIDEEIQQEEVQTAPIEEEEAEVLEEAVAEEEITEEPEEDVDLFEQALASEVKEDTSDTLSELDRLRQRNAQLEGALEERRTMLDQSIQTETVEEAPEEEEIDFTSKAFREKIGEIIS